MSLAETTLSAAVAADANSIVVASATSIAAGRVFEINGEIMQATKDYTSGTTVNVLRALDSTIRKAHPSGARVTHGDAVDFGDPAPGTFNQYPLAGIGLERKSYSASGAITLPTPGANMLAILNGTSVLTMTVAAPSKAMDGCRLTVVADGAAAHTLEFTGGLGGAGASYDIFTFNGTGTVCIEAVACNERWHVPVAIGAAGTLTNVTATLA